jgi:hypothetical protein
VAGEADQIGGGMHPTQRSTMACILCPVEHRRWRTKPAHTSQRQHAQLTVSKSFRGGHGRTEVLCPCTEHTDNPHM